MLFDEFKNLTNSYNVIPVSKTLLADTLTPVSAYLCLRDEGISSFLFESVEGGEHVARYSFLGRDPVALLSFDGRTTTIRDARGERTTANGVFGIEIRAMQLRKFVGDDFQKSLAILDAFDKLIYFRVRDKLGAAVAAWIQDWAGKV